MVKIYAVSLAAGVIGLVILIIAGAFADERRGDDNPEAGRLGSGVSQLIAGLAAFGMGGLVAEFAPLDIEWPVALLLAVIAGAGGVLWVRYSMRAVMGS